MELKGLSAKRKKQMLIAVIALTVIVTIAISAVVYGRYVKGSKKTENKLSPAASVTPEINEDLEDNVKRDVSINVEETNYPVYVRAKILMTWKSSDGKVFFKAPVKDEDYTIALADTDWIYSDPDPAEGEPGDGFYYYTKPVASKGNTGILIKECKPLKAFTDMEGNVYTLSVEIISQTVQAVGHTDDGSYMAVEDAWNYYPIQQNNNNE